MLKIELTSYGLYDTLKEIRGDLNSALGSNISKKRKDEMIYKALGCIDALWNLVQVIEEKPKEDNEEECGFLT